MTVRSGAAYRALTSGLLALPAYRRLWLSGVLYYGSYYFEIITTGWIVLQLTGSAFAVGLVGFSRMLPMLLLGLVMGAISDRVRRTTLLLAIDSIALVVATLLTVLFLTDTASLWMICIASATLGCVWAADFSTRRALIGELTDSTVTSRAMSLEAVSLMGSKIIATILAGGLLAFGGGSLAYGFLALVYLSVIISVVRLRRAIGSSEQLPTSSMPLLTLIRSGVTSVLNVPGLRAVLLVTVFMNLLIMPYQQIIAVVAEDILSVGPQRMGILAGMDGVGAMLAAGILVFRAKPSRTGLLFLSGPTIGGLLIAGVGLSTIYPLSLILQLCAGLCIGAFSAMQPVLILNAIEPNMRARAMGLLAMAIGVTPFGILISGGLSSLIGASWTIASMACIAVLLNVIIVLRDRVVLRM